jgi:hypothetical protein
VWKTSPHRANCAVSFSSHLRAKASDSTDLIRLLFLYGLLDPPSSGLELYRLRPTDLVITGIVIPERNGLDILLELTCEFLDAKVISISGARGGKNDSPLHFSFLLNLCKVTHMPSTDVHALEYLSSHNPPRWLPWHVFV